MSIATTITHNPGKYYLIRENFVEITGGDDIATRILSILEYWSNIRLTQIQEKSKPNSLWLRESVQNIIYGLTFGGKLTCRHIHDRSVRTALKKLEKWGFIESRPADPSGRFCPKEYRLAAEKIHKAINKSSQSSRPTTESTDSQGDRPPSQPNRPTTESTDSQGDRPPSQPSRPTTESTDSQGDRPPSQPSRPTTESTDSQGDRPPSQPSRPTTGSTDSQGDRPPSQPSRPTTGSKKRSIFDGLKSAKRPTTEESSPKQAKSASTQGIQPKSEFNSSCTKSDARPTSIYKDLINTPLKEDITLTACEDFDSLPSKSQSASPHSSLVKEEEKKKQSRIKNPPLPPPLAKKSTMTETTKWTDEQFTRIIKMLSAQAERGSKVVPPALRGEISQWGKQAPWKLSCGYSEDCYPPEFLAHLNTLPRCNYNTTPIQWLRRRDKSLLGWPDLWEVWCDFRRQNELKHKESEIAIPSSWQRKTQLAGRSPADYDDSHRRKILLALNWLYKELGVEYSAIGQVTRNSESSWELGWQKHINFKHWKFTNITITPDLCSQDKFGLFLVYFPDKGLCITDWDNLPIYCDRLLSWARSLRDLKKVSIPSS